MYSKQIPSNFLFACKMCFCAAKGRAQVIHYWRLKSGQYHEGEKPLRDINDRFILIVHFRTLFEICASKHPNEMYFLEIMIHNNTQMHRN